MPSGSGSRAAARLTVAWSAEAGVGGTVEGVGGNSNGSSHGGDCSGSSGR